LVPKRGQSAEIQHVRLSRILISASWKGYFNQLN